MERPEAVIGTLPVPELPPPLLRIDPKRDPYGAMLDGVPEDPEHGIRESAPRAAGQRKNRSMACGMLPNTKYFRSCHYNRSDVSPLTCSARTSGADRGNASTFLWTNGPLTIWT